MNKLILGIIIGLAVASLLVVGYYTFDYYTSHAYSKGVNDGVLSLVKLQTTSGDVYFLNQSGAITFNNIQEICKGVGGK